MTKKGYTTKSKTPPVAFLMLSKLGEIMFTIQNIGAYIYLKEHRLKKFCGQIVPVPSCILDTGVIYLVYQIQNLNASIIPPRLLSVCTQTKLDSLRLVTLGQCRTQFYCVFTSFDVPKIDKEAYYYY